MTVMVSDLIKAAQAYLERRGDTPVGVVVEGADRKILHIEEATALGEDFYDENGPWYFEIESVVTADEA